MRGGRKGRALRDLSAWVAFVAAAAAALAAGGCRACDRGDTPSFDAGASAALAPVPAPAGLVAGAVMPTPQATWAALQREVGGALALLPTTFGGVVCSLAGVDLAVAQEVDGTSPAYAAFGDDGAGRVGWVVAARVSDGRHVRAALERDAHGLAAEEREGMTVFTPRVGLSPAVALAPGGFVLVASRAADLLRLGPYASRTLPAEAAPAAAKAGMPSLVVDLPREAVATRAADAASRAWDGLRAEGLAKHERMRAERGGRAPDFGDPPAILAAAGDDVGRAVAALRASDGARVSMTVGEHRVDVVLEARLARGSDAGADFLAALAVGDAAPLGRLPSDVAVGVLLRDDLEARADGVARLAERVAGVLGARLKPDDATGLKTMLSATARTRGAWLTAGLRVVAGPELVARYPVEGQPEGAAAAMRAAVALARVPAFRDPLRRLLGLREPVLATTEVDGAKADMATFARDGRASVGLAWLPVDGDMLVVVSPHPVPALAVLRAPPASLSADAAIAGALARLGAEVSGVVLARPGLLHIGRAQATDPPVVLAWGRRDATPRARLELPAPIAAELLRQLMSF